MGREAMLWYLRYRVVLLVTVVHSAAYLVERFVSVWLKEVESLHKLCCPRGSRELCRRAVL